jgi:hypothetical protein
MRRSTWAWAQAGAVRVMSPLVQVDGALNGGGRVLGALPEDWGVEEKAGGETGGVQLIVWWGGGQARRNGEKSKSEGVKVWKERGRNTRCTGAAMGSYLSAVLTITLQLGLHAHSDSSMVALGSKMQQRKSAARPPRAVSLSQQPLPPRWGELP